MPTTILDNTRPFDGHYSSVNPSVSNASCLFLKVYWHMDKNNVKGKLTQGMLSMINLIQQ